MRIKYLLTTSYSRHPNYLGYTLWRTGASLATGSVPAALVTLCFQVFQFASAIPHLAEHMAASTFR